MRLGVPGAIFSGFVLALMGQEAQAAETSRDITLGLDLSWLLLAGALVMMMQVGFLLLEAGLVRSKNSVNVAQKNLLDFVFGVVAFAAIGFMMGFGHDHGLVVGWDSDFYFLKNIDSWQAGFFVFQVMFCGTAATIVSGAVAERMRLWVYVMGSLFLSGIIYPVFVHWAWGAALFENPSAYLANLGFVDFAGSTVVHATGGWVSLAACIVIGPRIGRFDARGNPIRITGHSPVLATTGALLLYIGWIGFNGGSTLKAVPDIARIILNTVLAGGVGACVGYCVGYFQDGVIYPEKSLSGLLGGLVAVTAGCHVLGTDGAMLIGAAGALAAVYGNIWIERRWKIDDAVGAIGVHAFAGVVGTVGLAVLAPSHLLPAGSAVGQLYIQAFGSLLNFYWTFCTGFLFFWLLNKVTSIRVTAEQEEMGLNVAEHGTRLGVGHVEDALGGLLGGAKDFNKRLPVVAGDEAEKLTDLFNRLMDNLEEEERERAELEKLKSQTEEAERVSALSNATFEAIVMLRDGIVVDGNEQLVTLAGRPMDQLVNRPVLEFIAPEDHERVQAVIDANSTEEYEYHFLHASGERIPVAARGRNIKYKGEAVRIGCIVDLRERKAAEKNIIHLAQHDPLTGLANRSLFNHQLAKAVEMALESEQTALLLIDLDRFKLVNDIHGHPAGDEVIREAARRLKQTSGQGSVVARLGGDEFAVIVKGVTFQNQMTDLGMRIVRELSRPIQIREGLEVQVGASVGISLSPEHGLDPELLVARADIALYHSKESGRNIWHMYRPGMSELTEKRRQLEADLVAAIDRNQFELHLQPRVDSATARIVSYEALLRWHHPDKGTISPADFIPVAEASGKIVQIGEWVIEEACRIVRNHLGDRHISINVSPIQFRQMDFLPRLIEIVEANGVRPEQIELEITESTLIEDDKRALHLLKALKAKGFSIALDDFGTGYSSLGYLSRYPFDTIKIDREFVKNLAVSENATLIIRTIIALGAGLGMRVVAEGVETVDQAVFLSLSGCDQLQGYLLGRAMPVDELLTEIEPTIVNKIMTSVRHERPHVSGRKDVAQMSKPA
jgi:ammonium transporter, Amt family